MLGTATKSEQDALIEQMNAEIARLREELNVVMETAQYWVNECEDLASRNSRLREELSRAAEDWVTFRGWIIYTLQQIAILGQEPVVPRTEKNPPAEAWKEIACQGLVDALDSPSPLAGLIREMVDDAVGVYRSGTVAAALKGSNAAAAREREAVKRLRASVRRYLALLEGRDRKEG